jgi:lambda family phage portal protein
MDKVQFLGADGLPLPPRRASMLHGESNVPYDAADQLGDHMAGWNPSLLSGDSEVNPYRDTIVGRIQDLVRNDGWAGGTVTRAVDNAIGANFRPVFKPDWMALQRQTGIKGFDHVWADEYSQVIEAGYRTWALDPGRYCDSSRKQTMPQMMQLGFRHKFIDGDALAMAHWLPERQAPGRARYCTAIQMIDPNRLSNPFGVFDTDTVRGGVEIDRYGAAEFYHIRGAHPGDYYNAAQSLHWDRVPRETEWGRPIILHDFDVYRAGLHRGMGVLAPVVQKFKALAKYDGAELDASIINAIFAAYIESPYDHQLVEGALDGGNEIGAYQTERAAFHAERRMKLGGARMPILFPGERINAVMASRPNANYGAFEKAVLRNISGATGLSPQQVSNDWSDVNYSSARGAMNEAWKTLSRRRNDFAIGFGQGILVVVAEEIHEVDRPPLPVGAPPYHLHRGAYSRARWMGPGRGLLDAVKERQGAVLGMQAGLSTLESEAAELGGEDWRENLAQRRIEVERLKELGLPMPDWVGAPEINVTGGG